MPQTGKTMSCLFCIAIPEDSESRVNPAQGHAIKLKHNIFGYLIRQNVNMMLVMKILAFLLGPATE